MNKRYNRLAQLIVVGIVIVLGLITLLRSFASTPAIAVEPETGATIGNVTTISSSGASSGKSLVFGNANYGPQPMAKPAGAIDPDNAPYNAVGDGATDDTAALQSALNDATGKTLWLPNKIYAINKSLVVASNTTIIGAGSAAVLKFSWFDTCQAAAPNNKGAYLRNRDNPSTNITYSNFVVEGGGSGLPSGPNYNNPACPKASLAASVIFNGVSNFIVTHLEVRNSPGLSISYHEATNATLTYNYVHNSGRDGITGFWANGSGNSNNNITVANNYIYHIGDDGIAINGLPEGSTVNTALPSNITIINNTVEGWQTDPTDNPHKLAGRGILLVGLRHGLVQNNSIINTARNSPGIMLVGCYNPFCSLDNDSRDPATGLPWLTSDVQVLGNTVYNAGQLPGIGTAGHGNGILIDTTKDSTISNNRVIHTFAGYLPIRPDGCSSCTMQGNITQ